MTAQGMLEVIEVFISSTEVVHKVIAGDVKGCPRLLAAQGVSKVAESCPGNIKG